MEGGNPVITEAQQELRETRRFWERTGTPLSRTFKQKPS
jgi:hypothetical protein